MPVTRCATIADARDVLGGGTSPVVVIPVFNGYDDLAQCLQSIVRHAPAADVLLIDDGSSDPRVGRLPDELRDVPSRVVFLPQPGNRGFVCTVNAGFEAAGRRDVVIVNSDVIVGPEWLERLRDAAYSDTRIATATPFTNHGSIVSVPYRNIPAGLLPDLTPESAAIAVAAGSSRLRPRLPTCVGHCTYIKRMALDLVGVFDEALSPGYGEEVDFSQRCTLIGLAHVCADDVFVFHRGGGTFGKSPEVERIQASHERIIAERYPFYHSWVNAVATARGNALDVALGEARRALCGMTVAVDATCLGPVISGTQRSVIETILALARHTGVARVVAVVPESGAGELAAQLSAHPKVRTVTPSEIGGPIADVVYRPFQFYSVPEVARVRAWGETLVVAQLDLIAFNNPGYFGHWSEWLRYREGTSRALAAMDGVAFLSEHSRREALEEGLLAPGQPAEVIYCGTDHITGPAPAARPDELPEDLEPSRFVLCLGADYQHKNRYFALRVFAAMIARGCTAQLVFAGPRIPEGSSRGAESAFLLRHPDLARRVVSFAHVSEASRTWLLRNACLVLNPTLYEGFGLVPFEAAAAGTPCLTSAQCSLGELLASDVETITDWDVERVADQAMGLLGDAGRRGTLIEALERRAAGFTWDGTAERLVRLFRAASSTVRGPRVAPAADVLGAVVAVEANGNGNGANPLYGLVGEMYPPEFHEAMRAIGQRRRLRGPLVAVTLFGYRIVSAVRQRIVGQRENPDGPA